MADADDGSQGASGQPGFNGLGHGMHLSEGGDGVVRGVMMDKRESFASDIVVSVWRKKSPVVKPGLERILETGALGRNRGDNGRLQPWFPAQGGVTGPCTHRPHCRDGLSACAGRPSWRRWPQCWPRR